MTIPASEGTLTPSDGRRPAGRHQSIEVRALSKVFEAESGPVPALEDINLSIAPGEFVSLIGKSGCGKTTLLQIIAGLVLPTSGGVSLGDELVAGPSRHVGMVFQKSVLLRWRTILENVMLPAEIFGLPRREARDRARELLAMVGLTGFEDNFPDQLSGGMQQRAAIVRSLLYDPEILLMDEPFGALDALTREQMHLELLKIWETTGKTIVFVTHDIPEAVFLSDRVVLLSQRPGRIREIVDISLPRPRSLETTYRPEFSELRRHLRESMG